MQMNSIAWGPLPIRSIPTTVDKSLDGPKCLTI